MRRSPRLRAAISALVLAALIVAALGAWQVSAARDSQRAQIINGELTAARLASSAIASGISSRLQLVSNLAGQNGVAQTSAKYLEKDAIEVRNLYPEFSSLAVDSAGGRLLAIAPQSLSALGANAASRGAFVGAVENHAPYVSHSFKLKGVGLVIGLSAPFFTGGSLAGVIVATIPVSNFGSIIGSTTLQSGGTVVVLDQSGSVLTGPAVGSRTNYRADPAVVSALKGTEGTGEGSVPGFDGQRLIAYTPVPKLGWAVLVEQPTSALDNPIGTLTFHLALIDALVVIIVIGTAFLLVRMLRQLTSERDESSAVLASVGEGVAIVDSGGRIVRLNPALEKLSGLSNKAANGKHWTEAFP
ncbi:MAG: cache domain-containing protein, partial [Acidimicrobiales bacterium]